MLTVTHADPSEYRQREAANGGSNLIRGISPLNLRGPGYTQAAYHFLGRLEGR